MVKIDVRLKKEEVQILQTAVGKLLNKVEHDEFIFTNTTTQAVRFDLEDACFYLYSFTEAFDYYGSEEEVAIWTVEEKEYPFIKEKEFVSTPIKEKISAIKIVQEHQELFENNQQTYDVWVTRGIIVELGDHEVAFEKPAWFSEDIVIRKGYNLIETFRPIEEITKAERWRDGVKMNCYRKIVYL